jgi:hypothetical protein
MAFQILCLWLWDDIQLSQCILGVQNCQEDTSKSQGARNYQRQQRYEKAAMKTLFGGAYTGEE